MQFFSKPYNECCLLSDPQKIYDLVGWDATTRKYLLRDDDRVEVNVEHYEFIPLHQKFTELVEADSDGRLITVAEALESGEAIRIPTPSLPEFATPSKGFKKLSASSPAKPKAPPKDTGPAREKVRELFAPCKTREEIAEVASSVLSVPAADLIEKYTHLDNGRFRMVLGNRMVSSFK
jgi:hypothetical protein